MPGTFSGINTLTSALDAFQMQLDVTGENVSNVDTPGYSRQTVDLQEAPGSYMTYGHSFEIGNGVTVESIQRIQNQFLQASTNGAASSLGMANQQVDTASNINSLQFATASGGISSDLDSFFNAWSGLASNPTDATKLSVQQAGQTLATDISTAYAGLESVKSTTSQQVSTVIGQIQSDANQIASLNKQITTAKASGADPNTLEDERDQTVQNLATLTNVNVQKGSDGSYVVSTGNLVLVDQKGARTVPTQWDASTGSLVDGTTKYSVQSGQLAGLFDGINKISSYEGSLNTLANTLRTQVNGTYSTAKASNGQTGALFFAAGTGAAGFDLDSTGLAGPPPVAGVKNDSSAISTGTTGNASDVGVAQQLFALSNANEATLGNTTMTGYFGQLVGQIGADGQNANTAQSTTQAISQQVQNQVQSVSGVNVNDELSNLLQFQRSYQAAAQAVSSIDQTIQSIISMVNT